MDAIAQRLKRINVTPVDLAAQAGVNYATIYRGLQRPGSTTGGNLLKLTEALIESEIELRDYLLGLHPLPQTVVAD